MKSANEIRDKLLTAVGASYANLNNLDLWTVYLTSLGYTNGTLVDRVAKAAAAAGKSPDAYFNGEFGGLGPELAPTASSGLWSTSGTVAPTQDGAGIHFSAASNLSAAFVSSVNTENDVTYRVVFSLVNYAGGGFRVLVYGFNSAKLGLTPTVTANGDYSYDVITSSAGSNFREIRLQATGTSGTNTFDITSISVKKVL